MAIKRENRSSFNNAYVDLALKPFFSDQLPYTCMVAPTYWFSMRESYLYVLAHAVTTLK